MRPHTGCGSSTRPRGLTRSTQPSMPRWGWPGKPSPRLTPTREAPQTKPSPSSPGVRSNPPNTNKVRQDPPPSIIDVGAVREPPASAPRLQVSTRLLQSARDPRDQLWESNPALVERGADHHACYSRHPRQGGHVFDPADATAGDGGDYLGDGPGRLQGRPRVHAVARHIGVEDGGDPVGCQLPGEVGDRASARSLPAVRRDDPFAGVDGYDEGSAGLLDRPETQVPVFDRGGSHHYPPGAGLPCRPQIFHGAYTPSYLERDADRPGDAADQPDLDRPALLRPVEVDYVDRPGPLTLPLAGALYRVGIVLSYPPEVSLPETHASSTAHVYGRIDGETTQTEPAQARKFSYNFRPALLLFSGWNWTATRFSLPAAEQKCPP